VLEVYTRQAYPERWAATQNNLGNSYLDRILGEKIKNLEEAIGHYELALEVYTRQAFPEHWAETHKNLADTYSGRSLGERVKNLEKAQNLEEAIGHYELALEIYTRETFPEDWAKTHNNLGLAYYRNPVLGARAKNLEQAIGHLEQALEVYRRETFPEQWATIHSNLGLAYEKRTLGERAENLEKAIGHFELALEVRTREAFSEGWAETQKNLASVYRDRIRGKRARNLEKAIGHFEQALEVYTRQAFPEGWAETHTNLANAYLNRIRGERAENLEEAIGHFELALEVYTRQAFPEYWAMTHNNLGNAYSDRILGEKAKNLEEAIGYFELALEVYTREAYPEGWAMTHNNLAVAYRNRILGERAENLEEAIGHYEQALEVYTRQALPERWATIHSNLGLAYSYRILGERTENLEEAIGHCEQALEVYTRQAFPERWATTHDNLGLAYSDPILGERAENLEEAIGHYELALEVWTAGAFPQDCRDTAYTLGNLLYEKRRFTQARTALIIAHQAVEALRGEITREGAKRNLAEENADLYARLVHCCLLDDDEEAAFKYAAAGKGRAFVDLLATARFDFSTAGADYPKLAEDLREIRDLNQQIGNLLARPSTNNGPSGPSSIPAAHREKMRIELRARQQEYDALWEEMTFKYPALTATQQAPAFTTDEARALAADLGATLVEYYEHAGGWCAFVVTSEQVRRVDLPDVDDDLLKHMSEWMKWMDSDMGLGPLSYSPLREMHEALIEPLRPYLQPDEAVVMAPFGELHLFPLGAAFRQSNGHRHYAADEYRLSFAPSLAALRVTLQQVRRMDHPAGQRPARCLLGVAYPGAPESENYLENAVPAAEAVARRFDQATPLYEDAATPDAVLDRARGQDVIHLVCHGSFDSEDPEHSGLELSGGYLTVQRIITELRLEQTRLATLSACESSQLEVRQAEEHVGLVQAVMSAGARAVVAGLWEVEAAATHDLFDHFYDGVTHGDSPADALRNAAECVRSSPGREHPYYWAAFQVSGLAHGMNGSENVFPGGGGSS
jgi:tetratricopeptide (TPR) repeat protein